MCRKVSDGCNNCYAERFNVRMGGDGYFLAGAPDSAVAAELALNSKALLEPLHWTKPRKVFVCSMTDLFGEWVPDEWIDAVFAVMGVLPQHTFQVLTKRAKRMQEYLTTPDRYGRWCDAKRNVGLDRLTIRPIGETPLSNVWLGVSVESQAYAWRLNHLMETPAAVRFASCEPLLGPLDLWKWLVPEAHVCGATPKDAAAVTALSQVLRAAGRKMGGRYLDWAIAGGESGPGEPDRKLVDADRRPKPEALAWVRQLRNQCTASAVPFLFKQWGGLTPKSGGRALDGMFWDQYPTTPLFAGGVPYVAPSVDVTEVERVTLPPRLGKSEAVAREFIGVGGPVRGEWEL
jgi:protein gp37